VKVLVLDIGTSSVRASVFGDDVKVAFEVAREMLPESPADGLVEFDAAALATGTPELAETPIQLDRTILEPVHHLGAIGGGPLPAKHPRRSPPQKRQPCAPSCSITALWSPSTGLLGRPRVRPAP